MLTAGGRLRALLGLALAGCGLGCAALSALFPRAELGMEQHLRAAIATADDPQKGALELQLADLLLARVPHERAAIEEARVLLESAEHALRSENEELWGRTQFAYGRYWLHAREPSLDERILLARERFRQARSVLILPEHAPDLATMHALLGVAEMQLTRIASPPDPHFQRARDHFTEARMLWKAVGAWPESEAMMHAIRRVDDERSGRMR